MWCSSSFRWRDRAIRSRWRTTPPPPCGRRGRRSGSSTTAIPGARRSPRRPRRLRLALTLPTIGLVLSVVYGQFHYAVDALAGLAVAAAVLGSQSLYAFAPARAARPRPLPEGDFETGRA